MEAKRANIEAKRANMDAKRAKYYKFELKCRKPNSLFDGFVGMEVGAARGGRSVVPRRRAVWLLLVPHISKNSSRT